MNKEAKITVNGKELTPGESMTVRVALEGFASDLQHRGLGPDEMGQKICKGYLGCIDGIRKKMY